MMREIPGYHHLKVAAKLIGKDKLKADLAAGERKAFALDYRKGEWIPLRIEQWLGAHGDWAIRHGYVKHHLIALNKLPIYVALQAGEKHVDATRNKGGRPPKADWETIEDLLAREIEARGYPDPENWTGWQRKADVERWVFGILEDRNEEASETTVKTRVASMLLRLKK